MFKFLAASVIAVSVITSLSKLTEEKNMGAIFKQNVWSDSTVCTAVNKDLKYYAAS